MDERLPEGWVWTTLGEIGWVTKLAGFEFTNYFKYQDSGPIRVVRGLNVGFGSFRDNNFKYIDQETSDALPRSQLNGGELLMAYVGTLGTIAILPKDGYRYHLGPNVCKIVLDSSECSSFVKYFLTSPGGQESIWDSSKAVAQSSLSMERIRMLEIPLAPLPEQNRIVAAIEQQFTRLDSAVASLQSAKARIKQYRASLLKSAVEGELTKTWRAAHPASETGAQLLKRILAERRARWEEEQLAKMREKGIVPKDDKWKERYKAPQEPDVENLAELPEGWCWTTLEAIAYIQLGKMLSPKAFEQHLIQLPYLRNENIRWGSIDYGDIKKMGFKEEELEKYTVLPDDLLVCEGGEPGRCAVYKENTEYVSDPQRLIYQKALHRVRMIENVISPHFIQLCLQYYVASQTIIPKFSETTIRHLPLEKISILPFPLPPLIEIAQIIAEVEANLTNIAKLEETTENSLKRAERERQSILREAFAGRLVPQDAEDEPASILLERIREERKKREEAEQVRRREQKVVMGQRRGKRKSVAPLYDVLVEAGGELPPEDLYKRSEEQRKEKPEQERDEEFYMELDTEVVANLIVEERPTLDRIVLRAVEWDDEALEEEDEEMAEIGIVGSSGMRQAREEPLFTIEDVPEGEMRQAREEPLFNLKDLPAGEMRQARDEEKPRT